MESSSLSLKLPTLFSNIKGNWRRSKKYQPHLLQVSAFSYQKFIDFALSETQSRTVLTPSPLQEKYGSMTAMDGRTELQMLSFEAPKIKLLRSLLIKSEGMQVLDFAVFARPEFDVPIFCANFFTTTSINIIVLDLNPLHNVIDQRDYKEKYYQNLLPLGLKYAKICCSFFLGEESSQVSP
uniref:Uncharacterized protein MANES_02G142200 n=1 Tax=Rhizophora mucronata TaxID=61149 RepID=A0A2P2JD89_RHIMU